MKTIKPIPPVERLVASLGECLTPESARRLLKLKADPSLQAHVDDLASRHNLRLLKPEEETEYRDYVSYNTFVAILKSKARQILATSQGE
jgi:hypothetical protein